MNASAFDAGRIEALLASRARLVPFTPPRPAPWAARPVRFDFGGGRPDPASLPYAGLARATAEVLEREGPDALTYGGGQGYDGLRDLIVWKLARREGLAITRDEVFITNGSSQAINIIADTFVDPGDVVITEAPTFSATLGTLRRHGAEVHGIPLDDEGMRTDALEARLAELAARGRRPKLIYTIDVFHNPTGVTLSAQRRRELLRLAEQHGVLVVEDEAYGDLRYEGEAVPSLYALDRSGLVLRCSTFSKILAAGVRLGYVVGHPDLIARLMPLKQDWGTNPFVSRVAAYYLREHLDEHVAELIAVYRRKRDAMLAGLERGLGSSASWSRPAGGFFVWLRLPDGTDNAKLAELAAERQVSYVSGAGFFPDGSGTDFIRLAFSYASVEDITEGIDLLAEAIRLAR